MLPLAIHPIQRLDFANDLFTNPIPKTYSRFLFVFTRTTVVDAEINDMFVVFYTRVCGFVWGNNMNLRV